MKRKYKILLGVLTGLIVISAAFGIFAWQYINSTFEGPEARWLYLPQGSSRAELADSLNSVLGERAGGRAYRIYCAAAPDSASIHGAYLIEPGTSVKEIAKRLVSRRQTPVAVTFNNLRTLPQLAERVASQMDFTPEEFLAACRTVLPEAGFASEAEYPAAFLPDTYEFYWTASAEKVVRKMLQTRNAFWTPERRKQAEAMGLTPVKVATVASIAEEETNNAAERATVGRLYINRLGIGMPLQADPTVKFAVGDFSLKRITGEHLKTDSPYNTYKNSGLPPGPIRIVDRTTLQSVLNSPAHDYIYMCARPDNSGLHNFTRSYSTHQANARAYQRWLDSRGIR